MCAQSLTNAAWQAIIGNNESAQCAFLALTGWRPTRISEVGRAGRQIGGAAAPHPLVRHGVDSLGHPSLSRRDLIPFVRRAVVFASIRAAPKRPSPMKPR